MSRSEISKCSGTLSCVPAFEERRMHSDCKQSQLPIGISVTAMSLYLSCKSQQQQANEGVDYAVLVHYIPNYIVAPTLFFTDRLLLCGIGDRLHGNE